MSKSIRHKVASEGRDARPLLSWRVGRERSEDRVSSWGSTGQRHTSRTSVSVTTTASPDHHSTRSVSHSHEQESSLSSSSGPRYSGGRRRPKSSLSPSQGLSATSSPSSSATATPDVALRERVFFYMCDQLRRLVDDLYNLCDESGVEEMCSEIIDILLAAKKDFDNLEDRIHKFDEHDQRVDEGLKPPSMVWDVRKVVSSGVDEKGMEVLDIEEEDDDETRTDDVSGEEDYGIHDHDGEDDGGHDEDVDEDGDEYGVNDDDEGGGYRQKSGSRGDPSDASSIMGSPKRIAGKSRGSGSQLAYRVVGGKRVPIADFDRDLSPSDVHSMTLAEKKRLRERLASPDRGQKKTPSEVEEAMNARLSAAEKKRDQQKRDRIERLRQSSVRVKEVTDRNEEKRIRKQLFAEERLAHADEKRDIAIRGIREKALDELTKAEEVVFIRTLQDDIDRQEKEEKMVRRVQQSAGRREEHKRELLRKTEEQRGLEDRVGTRKKQLEEERIKSLEEKEVTREEKKKRVIDERHRVTAAQRAKHEEKMKRMERIQHEEMKKAEETRARLSKKLREAELRQSQALMVKKEKARKSLEGHRELTGLTEGASFSESSEPEKRKQYQRRSKKMRQRIITFSRKYLESYQPPPVERSHMKLTRMIKELSTVSKRPPPLPESVGPILASVRDILSEVAGSVLAFSDLNGFVVLTDILSSCGADEPESIMDPLCDCLEISTTEDTNCVFVTHAGILAPWMSSLAQAIEKGRTHALALSNAVFLCLRRGFHAVEASDQKLREDYMSLFASIGCGDAFAGALSRIQLPMEETGWQTKLVNVILNTLRFILRRFDDSKRPIFETNTKGNPHLNTLLEETCLLGTTSFMSTILLHSGSVRTSQKPVEVPGWQLDLCMHALQILRLAAFNSLRVFQTIMGSAVQQEFQHIFSFFSHSYRSAASESYKELVLPILGDLVLLIGYMSLNNDECKESLFFGGALSVLMGLAGMCKSMGDDWVKEYIYPTLLVVTFQHEKCLHFVKEEIGIDKLVAYLSEQISRGGSPLADRSRGLNDLAQRLPPSMWNDCLVYLQKDEGK